MDEILISGITPENFNISFLDHFDRSQSSSECWRRVGGEYVLVPETYFKEWNLEQRRSFATNIVEGIQNDCFGYAAFANGRSVGQIFLSTQKFGSRNQYIQLKMFHISAPYRGQGLGKALFERACDHARQLGAEKLYISANHTKESQAAYRKLGCTFAEEINQILADLEPQDIQMEYVL